MAGTHVEFPSNGGTSQGYLAIPTGETGIGVLVLQEWWGLVPHIEDVCDRFAEAGFVALAPDMYHGEKTTSPDDAGKLMMALNIEQAEKDLRGATQFLVNHDRTAGDRIGTVGFCMGGQLSLFAATKNPSVGACVNFYGIHPNVKPDFSNLQGPVLGFFGSRDPMVTPDVTAALEASIKQAGKEVAFHTYDADHAFFNDTRPDVYAADAARDAWNRMITFYRENLN
ncbi:MAG: dienelactone hydrolase family protein [Candidatus Eisenbacteria bacterium]|uniref:Dienelactone hydrolase family protein n=1 Tax=Eiseniibacteriota bacterium TaxID=2212470 RepID=A0A7Y2EAS4_UNCEI|nr:dienelactone hydrolase family protein [Candidatus Eisenbacteria bacterium]